MTIPKISKAIPERYEEGVGGRKTAVARVRVSRGGSEFTVNNRPLLSYFRSPRDQAVAADPLKALGIGREDMKVSAHVSGGGLHAQAEAVRHGLARALVGFDSEWKKRLRRAGFLTRDARAVERKKYGLKKARRAPQWAKR